MGPRPKRVIYKNGWVEYKLALPRFNSDLAAGHSSLLLSPSISLPSCVTSASSCCVISPRSHQFSKHSDASIDSSLRRFLSGLQIPQYQCFFPFLSYSSPVHKITEGALAARAL